MDQYVIVVEDDDKIKEYLFKVLKKINPSLKIRYFDKLELFSSWISVVIKEGELALETAGIRWKDDLAVEAVDKEKRLSLVVCKQEIFGSHFIPLISKSIDLFIRKNLCTEQEKTSIVMTAFEHEDFNIKTVEESFINNVIYKPFDSLIAEEHLRYAILGRKLPKDENLKNSKLAAQVEMVKDIPAVGFSDLGFLTVSDREIKLGDVSKYYSDEFLSGSIKSTMAKCVKCEPDPDKPEKFLCWMEYFALEDQQIKKVRKDINMDYPNPFIKNALHPFSWNVVYFDSFGDMEFASSLKRFYPEINVLTYNKWEDFEFDYDPEKSEMIVEKDLPAENEFTVHLDPSGHFFIDFTDIPEGESLFGESKNSIKSKDFQLLLTPDSKKKWMEVFKNQKVTMGAEPVFVIFNNNKKFIFKLAQFSRGKTKASMPSLELKLTRLPAFEKTDFLKSMTPLMKNIDLVIGSEFFLKNCIKKKYYEQENKILTSKNSLSDKEKKHWSEYVKDILYFPFDRAYAAKKIYLLFSDKNNWDKFQFVAKQKEIQSAQQVQIDEISEAGIIFKYHRPIEIGSFRRFYLWTPKETELLDYHANCNYIEELKEPKGSFLHHFVFFGVRDIYLKNIRLWVRDMYIQSKSKNND